MPFFSHYRHIFILAVEYYYNPFNIYSTYPRTMFTGVFHIKAYIFPRFHPLRFSMKSYIISLQGNSQHKYQVMSINVK